MGNFYKYILAGIAALSLFACTRRNLEELPAIGPDHYFRMVVEIPAGSSLKNEYNPLTGRFEAGSKGHPPRIIDFLPYPGNYGFIPSTRQDQKTGGDGDPLDVLLIGPPLAKGTVVKILPVGILKMTDAGETDHKIIAIPADPDARTLQAFNYATIFTKYPAVLNIIETWFLNYKGSEIVEIEGWGDETEASRLITNAMTPKP